MTSLKTELAGVELKNPTVMAAGILGNSGPILKRIAKSGAGAVTTKSISLEPKAGNESPNIAEIEDGMLNSMGLPNPGIENFLPELEKINAESVPVIGSAVGKSVEEYLKVAEKFDGRVDIIELNLSCPNVDGGLLFCQDPKLAKEVVRGVKKRVEVPVFAKLGPNVNDISEIAKAVERAESDGITAINTMPAMTIDLETGRSILNKETGGLSGKALKPIALRCVYEISEAVEIPIIGTGGVSTGEDAAQMLMAGASAVGIGTAVKEHGFDTFEKITEEFKQFMKRKRFKKLDDLVGLTGKTGGK